MADKGGSGTKGSGDPESGTAELESGPEVSPESIEAERSGEGGGGGDSTEALLKEIADLRRELADARAASEKAARRAAIERALSAAGAIDLEITTPLVEELVSGMDEPDVDKAVRAVRAGKGFLFRTAGGGSRGGRGSVMAGLSGSGGAGIEDLAGDARSSGDRNDLLRYLRARRG